MQHSKLGVTLLAGALLIAITSVLSIVPLVAQETTVITIGIEEFQQQFINDESFEEFEAANPGVDVVTVILSNEERYYGAPQDVEGIEEFVENTNTFAGQADLLPLDFFNNPRVKTRAGTYLDLTPLINADADANLEDFYPSVIESLQWDGGTWGLPVSASVQILVYDQIAFDEAGLAYPDASWTLDDFINAGEVLTEFDDEGNIVLPGFFGFDPSVFFASLIDGDLSDPTSFPSVPLINTPETVAFVEQWAAYQDEYYPEFGSGFNFNFQEIPIQISGTFLLNDNFNSAPEGTDFAGTLLPGNTAGIQVQAYGVSAGTSNPQLAYELLQYMTKQPEIAFSFFGDVPARQSLVGVDTSDLQIFRPESPEELQSLIDEALANAIPASDYHFMTYLSQAASTINNPEEGGGDAATVLQDIQENVLDVFAEIDQTATSSFIEVATPVPTPVLSSDEIALNFGIESNFGQGAEREVWDAVVDEFVAQDPQVGQIILNSEFMTLEERLEEQDCFYLASNLVQSADLTQFFPIDPFFTTDSTLNPDNFVSSTLEQVSRDNQTWALPLSITPNVMWYNSEAFADAGLPEPSNDWNITEFVDALNALDDVVDGEPYRSQGFGGVYFYMLVAAYGGFPVDYANDRYEFNLDDPATIEAIRQVMRLVEDGLIDYTELSAFGGGGGGGFGGRNMFDAVLSPNDFRLQNRGENNPVKVVMFPRGADYLPLTYSLATGQISANTPAPDACYRWLSFISRQPEILNGMPAQVDLFESVLESFDDASDVVILYEAFNEALQSPSAVIVPSPFTATSADPVAGTTNFLQLNWINLALDDIALNDADVEIALANAQTFIEEFRVCAAGIEESMQSTSDISIEEQQEFFGQFARCAVAVDPSLADDFSFILNEDEEE